jgi:hypothetical protein
VEHVPERRKPLKCLNCKQEINPREKSSVEVWHKGNPIGGVCEKCLLGVARLRLFLGRDKDESFKLREMQVLPKGSF